jgi:hypothetical protein
MGIEDEIAELKRLGLFLDHDGDWCFGARSPRVFLLRPTARHDSHNRDPVFWTVRYNGRNIAKAATPLAAYGAAILFGVIHEQ